MRRFAYTQELRLPALEDQLRAAGLNPTLVEGYYPVNGAAPPGGIVWFADDDPATAAQINAVVAAHDAAALDAADAQVQTRRRQARQIILGYPDLAPPTNAQTVAAVKALCLAVAELYRTN